MSRWKVRAWYATDALVRRVRPSALQVGLRAVRSGLCLGLASPETLVALDEEAYASRRYAYHDTDAHNLRGLFDWEERALDAFPARGRLLVTAAGGGREVIALARRGYDVLGCECNDRLRARAHRLLEQLGLDAEIVAVPRDRCFIATQPFDAAIVGWGSWTFLRGSAARRRFLEELAASLKPGAPVLLSFFARDEDRRRFRLVCALGNSLGRLTGAVPVELGDVVDPTWQHYVSRAELERELEAVGYRLERWSREGYAHALVRAPTSELCSLHLAPASG